MTTTPVLGLDKPADGATGWGAAIRGDLDTLDALFDDATGHDHDGTGTNGPNLPQSSITDLVGDLAAKADATALAAHLADTSAAHAASAIGFGATGGLSSTDVQAALAELDTEKAAASHTHTASQVTDFAEAVDDRAAALLVEGAAIDLAYNDGAGSLTVAVDIPSLTADATPDGAADYVLTYDASASAHKKVLLDNLPGGGGGGASDAVDVAYDNATSGLAATDVQAALDELAALGGGAAAGPGVYFMPGDVPPASPHASDDEFDDSTVDAAWTWLNQGAAVATEGRGVLHFSCANTGNEQLRALMKAAPAGDFTVSARMRLSPRLLDIQGAVLVLSNAAHNKILICGPYYYAPNGGPLRIVFRLTGPNASFGAVQSNPSEAHRGYYRWRVASGTAYFDRSDDGIVWINAYSEAVSAFLGSVDEIGIGVFVTGTNQIDAVAHWFRVEV